MQRAENIRKTYMLILLYFLPANALEGYWLRPSSLSYPPHGTEAREVEDR